MSEKALALTWSGEVLGQKWMNFYTKVLAKFATSKNLRLTVKVEAALEAGVSTQVVQECNGPQNLDIIFPFLRWWAALKMKESQCPARARITRLLDRFKSRLEAFENVFGQLFNIERLRLTTEEDGGSSRAQDRLLRYIHRCLTGNDHPIAAPEIPVHLNDLLSSEDFCGGIAPRIGGKRIHVVAIDGLPRTSSPGLLRDLDSIPIEYRWNTRALLIDPEEARALLDNTRRKWRSKIRGWKDQVFRTQTGPVNLFAHEMAADAEAAMGIASAGDVQFAQYSSNVVLLDEDAERLRESTRLVMKTIQHLGFACRLETINAIEAWRGSLPGDGYRNVRRTLVHTLNVADLLPTSSVWAGQRENPSSLMPKHSPPLLYAATTGATPFRFNLHVSDLGHTLVCGPSGAGKSTLLGLIAAQWFRYERAQVFAFDKGYSLYVLNKAANGEFYDLAGPKTRLAFCPLRELDTDADVTWAVGWLEALCVLNNLKVTPKHRNALTEAVQHLRLSPSRTLTELSANVQDMDVRDALQHFTLAGPLGSLLDADEDVLGSGRFLTFETENLLQLDDKSVLPVLLYLFRRIEKRLDGSPTLVLLDEAWVYLRHGLFRERMRDWLKTLRRMNGVVVMATQQLSDICNSEIADVVIENCPTKILLPNAESRSPGSREFYQRVGLNERESEHAAHHQDSGRLQVKRAREPRHPIRCALRAVAARTLTHSRIGNAGDDRTSGDPYPSRGGPDPSVLEDARFQRAQRQSAGCAEANALGYGPPQARPAVLARSMDGSQQIAMVGSEACQCSSLTAQESEKRMRRKRFQRGCLKPRKRNGKLYWYAQWREFGEAKSRELGLHSTLIRAEAETMLAAILQPINEGVGKPQRPVFTFKAFVDSVYLPVYRGKWKASTAMTEEERIRVHLVGSIGTELMSKITREHLQSLLGKKAKVLAHGGVDHLRFRLRSIFELAVSEGVVDRNPAVSLFTPRICQRGRERLVLTPEDIAKVMEPLELRERLIVRLATFEGMRPGEILGLQVGDVDGNSVWVRRRLYKGNIDLPKTRRSARQVALSAATVELLRYWSEQAPETKPEAWLFPAVTLNSPVRRDNVWRRNMLPKLRKIGMDWATFQVMRRTFATLSKQAGVDAHTRSAQMGNTVDVNENEYAVSSFEDRLAAVRKLEATVVQ